MAFLRVCFGHCKLLNWTDGFRDIQGNEGGPKWNNMHRGSLDEYETRIMKSILGALTPLGDSTLTFNNTHPKLQLTVTCY